MSRAADDKAIDKDLDDLSFFLVRQAAWFHSDEHQVKKLVDDTDPKAEPGRVDAMESLYQGALKNSKEVYDAHSMFNRLRAEIKQLRRERRS